MHLEEDYVIAKYSQNLYRMAFSVCRSEADAQDAVQETFVKYWKQNQDFESEEHIRNWLMKTVINQARDIRRSFFVKNRVSWQETMDAMVFEEPKDKWLFETVMEMNPRYRVVLQLFYYENYSVKEIADLLACSESAVKTRLCRARARLKEKLEEEWNDE